MSENKHNNREGRTAGAAQLGGAARLTGWVTGWAEGRDIPAAIR